MVEAIAQYIPEINLPQLADVLSIRFFIIFTYYIRKYIFRLPQLPSIARATMFLRVHLCSQIRVKMSSIQQVQQMSVLI
jgi:hypothetical protein